MCDKIENDFSFDIRHYSLLKKAVKTLINEYPKSDSSGELCFKFSKLIELNECNINIRYPKVKLAYSNKKNLDSVLNNIQKYIQNNSDMSIIKEIKPFLEINGFSKKDQIKQIILYIL